MKDVTCGFLIMDRSSGKYLLGHATMQTHWDLPKGRAEKDENHLIAAFRELKEETGLILPLSSEIKDLGEHVYSSSKNCHLFSTSVDSIDLTKLECTSLFDWNGKNIPEMDKFGLFTKEQVLNKVGKSMCKYLKTFVFNEE